MAKELLPDRELCEGRFVVLKTLSFGEEGGVYLVKRAEDGTRWVLKEIIPPATAQAERLERRVHRFREAMEGLTLFDHPHLCKIVEHFSEGRRQYVVMERVEGITLQQLSEMSVNPHPEEQVMKWALVLCDALHYMHDRPQPFLFQLDPSHIMITPEKELKLINFGLARFLADDEADEFGTSAEHTARDLRRFAETLVLLLTKKPPGPLGLGQADDVSPELAKLINRALTGDVRRTFPSFDDFSKQIDRVLHPPPPVETVVAKKTWLKSVRWDLTYGRVFQNLLVKFLRQPFWLAIGELAGVLVLAVVLYFVTHPAVERRTMPAAYVVCGGELWAVATGNRSVFTRIRLPEPAASVVASPQGDKLFLAADKSNRLLVYNSQTNRMLGYVQVDQQPRQMVMDPRGEFLFVLHPATGQVGMVQLEPGVPKAVEQDNLGRLKNDRLVSIIAVGRQPEGMSLEADIPAPTAGATPQAEAPASPPGAARKLKLYVSNRGEGQLAVYEPNPPVRLASLPVAEPGASLLSPDGKTLFVASQSLHRIEVFSVLGPGKLRQRKSIAPIGGREPIQLLLRPGGTELWCLNASGSLGIINLEQLELRKDVELPGKPTGAAFVEKPEGLELWVALGDRAQVAVVDPDSRIVDAQIPVGASPTSLCVVK